MIIQQKNLQIYKSNSEKKHLVRIELPQSRCDKVKKWGKF